MDYYKIDITFKKQTGIWQFIGRLPLFIKKLFFKSAIKVNFIRESQGSWSGYYTKVTCPYINSDKELEEQLDQYVSRKIKKHSKQEDVYAYNIVDKKDPLAMLFLLEEMIEEIRIKKNISKKKLSIILIDGNTALTDYAIECVYDELNYFTIVSNRADHFESRLEEIYKESGLATILLDVPLGQTLDGNMVLDLKEERELQLAFFNTEPVYVPVYRMDFQITAKLELIDPTLMVQMFHKEYRLPKDRLSEENLLEYKSKINEFKEIHNLKIDVQT